MFLWFMPELFGQMDYSERCQVHILGNTLLWEWPVWVSHIVAYFAIALIMFWTTDICERMQIIPIRSAIPLFLGLLIIGCIQHVQLCNESYIAFILFILAVRQLLSMYHFEWQEAAGFNIVCLLGVASLFQPQFIWLILLFFVGMVVFRVISFRVLISLLLGAGLLCGLLFGGFWMFDSLDTITAYVITSTDFSFPWQITIMRSDIVTSIALILISIFAISYYFTSNYNYKLNVRLNFIFISLSYLLSAVWLLCFSEQYKQLLLIPILFMTFCLSLYLSTNYNKTSNIIFGSLCAVMLTYRIVHMFGI